MPCRDEERGLSANKLRATKACHSLDADPNDAITGSKILGGCCAFYTGHGCRRAGFLFTAEFRARSRLRPHQSDVISSLKWWLWWW